VLVGERRTNNFRGRCQSIGNGNGLLRDPLTLLNHVLLNKLLLFFLALRLLVEAAIDPEPTAALQHRFVSCVVDLLKGTVEGLDVVEFAFNYLATYRRPGP